MRKHKTKLILAVVAAILVFLAFYSCGYRFDGLSAAKANVFVPKNSVLIDQADYDWGGVYVFNSPEKPVTAVSIKKFGFLWSSRLSVYYFHHDDPIQTIGGISLANPREKATVFTVLVRDPDVSYIEAGAEGSRARKAATIDKPITFSWDTLINGGDLKPQAFDAGGKLVYEYRYATANYTRSEDLRWYPAK